MKAENLKSDAMQHDKYLNSVLAVLGIFAVGASTWVAWPALYHIGTKLI